MSRLAQAFRKAGRNNAQASTWDAVRGPFGGAQVPWDFTATPDRPRSGVVALRAPHLAPEPSGGVAGVGSGGDLAAMIRRIFQPDQTIYRRRAVVFAGVGAGASSARVSATVAEALAAHTSAPVCLVDADLRSPASRSGEAVVEPGLAEILLEGLALRSALRRLSPALCILPAGARRAEALRRLSGERLGRCVQDLLGAFDYLVVSSPPAAVHEDAALLAGLMDGLVLVVSASRTRREAARRTVSHLQQSNVNVLGSVLADRTFPIPEALYGRL